MPIRSDRLSKMLTNITKNEVAEALIATWCIEFLRMRKVGSFNVAEMILISTLILTLRTLITEASRRRYHDKARTYVMSRRTSQLE